MSMMMSTQSTPCESRTTTTTSNIETTHESTLGLTSTTPSISSLSTSNSTSSSKEEEDENETNAITSSKKEESSFKKQEEKQRKKEEGRKRAIEISKQRNNSTNKNTKKSSSIDEWDGFFDPYRHEHFLRWILQTFPDAIQSAQAPPPPSPQQKQPSRKSQKRSRRRVLDVAGKYGELSSRLTLCHNIYVTLIDPRPVNLPYVYQTINHKSLQTKWQQQLAVCTAANPHFVEWEVERKWKQLVDYFSEGRVEDCPELKRAVEECVLLIGLHTHGVDEAIVNVAKRFRKPFVVVPCCVFPDLFPERRVRVEVLDSDNDDGDGVTVVKSVPVRNHEQFCQYLLQMDSHFRGEILPFEGRNFGIWWDGKCLDSDDDS